MRRLAYRLLPGVGDGAIPKEGSLADLRRDIPYLLTCRLLPPLHIINEILRKGAVNAGMSGGCEWEPFAISSEEHQELVTHFGSLPEAIEYVESPDWVVTESDWRVWKMEYCHAIPSEQNRKFTREIERLEQQRAEALACGDQDRAIELLVRIPEISREWSDFMHRHRQPHRWERPAWEVNVHDPVEKIDVYQSCTLACGERGGCGRRSVPYPSCRTTHAMQHHARSGCALSLEDIELRLKGRVCVERATNSLT